MFTLGARFCVNLVTTKGQLPESAFQTPNTVTWGALCALPPAAANHSATDKILTNQSKDDPSNGAPALDITPDMIV